MDTSRVVEEQKDRSISMAAVLEMAVAKVCPLHCSMTRFGVFF